MPVYAAEMESALVGEREFCAERVDARARDDNLDESCSDRNDEVTTAGSGPINPHEVVPKPRRTALPALNVTDDIPMSIPMLEDAKVGPQNFEKIRLLGAGATGKVYLVKSIGLPTEGFYAMKVVKKSELVKRNRVQRILTEQQILSVAKHPFIVTLHYSFQSTEYFYLITQYCAGGEFFSFLRRQEKQRLSEAHAQFYAAEVLIALEYLHLLGIIYRDLKPENILVHESGHIMLADFDLAHELKSPSKAALSPKTSFANATGYNSSSNSLSSKTRSTQDNSLWFRIVDRKKSAFTLPAPRPSPAAPPRSCFPFKCICGSPVMYPVVDTESHLELGERRTSFVGTHEYVAPEIIAEEGYVGSVDWWAFGILLYEMIYSTTPFKGSTQIQTLENILDLSEDIDFPTDVEVSEDTKDLIRKLLHKTVSRRLQNPLQIKAHPFFRGINWPLIRHSKPPIVPDFVHTLQERELPPEKLSSLDDEVPFVAGISSPNTPRRKPSPPPAPSPQKMAAQATFPLTKATALNEPLSSADKGVGAGPSVAPRTSRDSSSEGTDAVSLHLSDLTAAISPFVVMPPASEAAASSPSDVAVSVPAFDYSDNSKPNYWSSTESTRALQKKLTEMRLATPEEDSSVHMTTCTKSADQLLLKGE